MIACYIGDYEIAKLLISNGAELDLTDTWHQTALHLAALKSHIEIINLLLSYGANPSLARDDALYPIDLAQDCEECVHLLHQRTGEWPSVKEALNLPTPSLYLRDTQFHQHFDDSNANKDLQKLIIQKQRSKAQHLITNSHSLDVNYQSPNGRTALALAAQHNDIQTVQALLKQNADPSLAGTQDGMTPLHFAAQMGAADIAVSLLHSAQSMRLVE
jgi:ankyrin repeat protein